MKLAKKTSLAVTGFFVAAIFLIPYIRMLITALTPANEVFEIPANYLPTSFDFSNFFTVWDSGPVARYILNTVIIAGDLGRTHCRGPSGLLFGSLPVQRAWPGLVVGFGNPNVRPNLDGDRNLS